MSERIAKNSEFDVLFLVNIAIKYKVHLILVTIVSVALAVIFSSETFIKPKFKSTAIAYPSNLVPYSTESPTEQMLQLFESTEIRDELIKDFDLFKHYGIDTTDKFPFTMLYGQMSENIKIEKTKYESVEIEVLDTDPAVASRMADSLLAKMHSKARELQREKSNEVVIILKNQLDFKKAEMDSMEKELMDIRMRYGILDFENQVKSFSKVYYSELAGGRASIGGNRPIDNAMKGLLNKGGAYVSLSEHLWRVRGTYNDLKVLYESALKDLTKELTYSNIITKPIPAEKKTSPVRSLIILMFTGSMLLLTFIVLVILENSKRVITNKTV